MRNHRLIACAALLLLLLGITTTLPARGRKQKQAAAAAMSEHQRALHALNRLTFGPRPGDVEKVESMGVDKWIDLQLHPEKIDDSSLNARLAPYRTLNMSTAEMIEDFPPPQVIKAVADGKLPMPRDPMKRAVYQAQIERYQERQQSKAEKADAADDTAASGADDTMMPADRERRRAAREQAAGDEPRLAAMPPDERLQAILKMDPNERMALVRGATPQVRQELMNDFTPQQQETVLALVAPQLVIGNELASAKLLRAVYSDRQLQEVMTDFWFNHFNVFINKGADRYLVTAYERDVIRPRALGKFKDLLLATAKSPAMLFYLDNWQSVGPDSDFAKYGPERQQRPFARNGGFGRRRRGGGFGRPFPPRQRPQRDPQQQAQRQQKRPSGLNENYAREVMELHTLGVDGGYTQNDVTELARVLTGWTIREPRRGGGFTFDERRHEPGTKIVLGHTFKDGGEKEGEQALEMLARSPATAHHISLQLAQRFVSDNPPPALVERMAATFLKSDGDIREVLRTMLRSPEFWSQDAYRAKVKTPLEFVASALRATNADVKNPQPLIGALNQMGMPLYAMQPPTGYSTQAQAWVNSAALLNRLNFALALGTGRLRGVLVDEKAAIGGSVAPDANGVLAALEQALLSGEVSAQTHDVLEKQLNDPQVTRRQLDDPARPPAAGVIAGLILGSPDFQKR